MLPPIAQVFLADPVLRMDLEPSFLPMSDKPSPIATPP
jgi:hypothetical protein